MSGPGSGAADPQLPPPPPPKPRLKINVSRSSSFVADAAATPARASVSGTPVTSTPSQTPGEGPRKLKLKVNISQPPTPAEQPAPIVKTKAGRQPKPTQKLVDSKKRARDDDDDDDDERPLAVSHPSKVSKIRIRQSQTPKSATQLVVKPRGRPPVHPPGDGYDSEASDREIDPAIEEQLVLRLLPGEDLDYLRTCVETGKMGIPRLQGGADFQIKFFEEETRRAIIRVHGRHYAAVLVDLPTITEAMKTWDKKSLMKSADICQMLLAYQKVDNDDEARHAPLPSMIDSNFKWPHGLTPPMHDAVNRRFAKTISRKEIENKEAEVERLLAEDAKANSSRWEWVDDRKLDDEDAEGEDAEGEVDDSVGYFDQQPDPMDDDLFEAEFEAAFAGEDAETPGAALTEGATPMTTQGETPAAAMIQDSIEADGDIFGEDGEEDDDDDDDDEDDDLDDDAREERDQTTEVKHLIANMQKQRAQKIAERDRQPNKILKTRLEAQIKQLSSEIALKKSSIGMEDDDDEEDGA